MSKPTKAQLKTYNAECYAKLIEELKVAYPKLADLWYSPHFDTWQFKKVDGTEEEDIETFIEALQLIEAQCL